jgi:hypothetical protein
MAAALVAVAWTVVSAQQRTRIEADPATGAISGKLTDLHSAPLDGATVVVRNTATGAEVRVTTARNGSYRLGGLEAGEYTLEAESAQAGRGRLEGILVVGGREARVQTALEFAPAPPLPEPLPMVAAAPAAGTVMAVLHPIERALSVEIEMAALRPAHAELRTAIPIVNSTFVVEPLRQMVVSARLLPLREMPRTVAAELRASLAAEPLGEMALVGRRLPAREMPAMEAVRLVAALSPEPLATLALTGQAVTEAARLQIGAARADSFVAAAKDADPATPVVATTVTGEQMQSLPVSGRRWQDFVLDTPAAGAGTGSEASLRGGGETAAETTVDGASTRLAFGGQSGNVGGPATGEVGAEPSGMARPWASGRGFAVAESAIREVETVAGNVEAEGARAAGGQMNVETRRGSNGLHGQGFVYDRANAWGARNPFTQWVKETAPATATTSPVFTPEPYTPSDRETTWGIGMGSQIRRDKLFWFGALDSYERNDPGLATVKHPDNFFAQPSSDQMQVESARLGLSGGNPVSEGLAAYSKMLETLGGLLGPAPRTASQWVGFGRLDWAAAERHRFTLEGIGARWNSPGGGLTRVSETYGTNSFGTSKASEEWLLGRWEAFATPNLLMVTQGSAGRSILGAHAETPSAFEQTLNHNVWGQLPQMVVDSRYGFTIGNPSRFGQGSYPDEHLYRAQEMVDWVKGGLLVKAGFSFSHNLDATSLLRNQTGTYNYANVENFASDALVYAAFGLGGELNPRDQHNCDQTGKVWRDTTGQLRGLGYLPCYSYYSQTMGPTDWWLSTNDWAGYATAQWEPRKLLVLSAGMRWEREQTPPPIAKVANPELPLAGKAPNLGNNWGPRFSLAWGGAEGHGFRWPVLRLGYGLYFGRTENATLETALTQTGSLKGDLNFFLRPTDNLNAGGAPPFPYVLAGEPGSVVKPGAVEFAPKFHVPEVHQAVAGVEESLPGRVVVTASAVVSLGRRLPISMDTNFDPAVNPGTITYGVVDDSGKGPIKATQITAPFYASWPSATPGAAGRLNPDYQQIAQIESRANSTYEAAMVKISRYSRRGLSLHAHYTYAHAMDWNPNESALVAGSDVMDPAEFRLEYGTGNLDVRHSAAGMAIYEAPWKLRGVAGKLGNGWMLSGIGQFRSGLPYTMRTSGALAKEFNPASGAAIVALGPGMNGSGGDNRVYGLGNDNRVYSVGRNTYRYPSAWKADLRLGKRWDLGQMRQLELLVESFNLFNHQNVTELETVGYTIETGSLSGTLPTLTFLTGLKANTTEFGQPLNVNATNFYRERQVEVGVRMRF